MKRFLCKWFFNLFILIHYQPTKKQITTFKYISNRYAINYDYKYCLFKNLPTVLPILRTALGQS